LRFNYNRNTSIKDRASSAIATVQHNVYVINIPRSRAESRINFIISSKGKSEHYQSATYLEEFIAVIGNAVLSISEVNVGSEQTVEADETSLSELQGATSKVSARLLSDLRQ
jgi:hypothetical protein